MMQNEGIGGKIEYHFHFNFNINISPETIKQMAELDRKVDEHFKSTQISQSYKIINWI